VNVCDSVAGIRVPFILLQYRHAIPLLIEADPTPKNHMSSTLLSNSTLVEGQLLSLQHVAVTTTALSRTGRNNGVQTTSLKLFIKGSLNLAQLLSLGVLGLDRIAQFLLPPCRLCGRSRDSRRATTTK